MIVTIGLPVYNAEKYIKSCITSILNQSYSNFYLLIVDDGSTDKSLNIIAEFEDDRIKVIVDGENMGLPYRLNQIANITTTKYLARMDADDLMHVDRLKEQINTLETNLDIDVLGSNCYVIDDLNKLKGVRYSINSYIVNVNGFIHPSIIAKTEWFITNPYNVELKRSQDAELWERTKKGSKFKQINKPLLFYREVEGDYYKKYQTNLRSKGVLLKMYFNQRCYSMALKYFLNNYLKAIIMTSVYTVAAFFNYERLLINTRSKKLSSKEILLAGDEINAALSELNINKP